MSTKISMLLLMIFTILFPFSTSIDSSCSALVSCPQNSFCNSNNYCQCLPGWVLDCKVPSTLLTTQFVQKQISSKPQYFTIVPSDTESIFVYRFQMCANVRTSIDLQLFADEGTQNELNRENLIGELSIVTSQDCWPLFSPYMQFNKQPNGAIQQMVLKIQLSQSLTFSSLQKQESGNSKAIVIGIPNQQQKITLKLRVEELYFLSKATLWIFIISFIVLIGLSFILGIVYCIYALRKGPNRFIDNNIKYFDKLLPKYKVRENDEYLGVACSICLLQFEVNDKIRKTPCKHAFHHDCLDIWCKKNLTCPVCRSSLQKSYIEQQQKKQKMDSVLGSMISSNANSISQNVGFEEQFELESDRRQNLREPLQCKQ